MKFSAILLTIGAVFNFATAQTSLIDTDAISHHATRLVTKVKEGLKSMPLKKSTKTKGLFKAKRIPHGLDRDYDMAIVRNHKRMNKRLGHGFGALSQPQQTSLKDKCNGGDLFGTALGFVYGLQYDKKSYSVCFSSLRQTVYSLDLLTE